jgi:probable F420-dependent oxidoreductase
MASLRPFRFGAGAFTAASAAEWSDLARRVEALGYDTLLMPDHFSSRFAPTPALAAAALSTTTVRVGTTVFANDFRHPAMLAKEMATLDLLSGGRLEVGIGAGWKKSEYEQAGISFESPGVRVERMQEAVHVLKGLWGDGPFTFSGRHYAIRGLENWPKPVQRPHPPIFIGAGGKRLLSFAAQEADIIGILAPATPDGRLDIASDNEERLADQVGWVREAAGERLDRIELAMLTWGVAVTDDRRAAAQQLAQTRGLTPEQALASPYYLIGSIDAIVEQLCSLRERFGLSYCSIFPEYMEDFAPVVNRLPGT